MGGSIQFATSSHIKHSNVIKVYLLSSILMIVHNLLKVLHCRGNNNIHTRIIIIYTILLTKIFVYSSLNYRVIFALADRINY